MFKNNKIYKKTKLYEVEKVLNIETEQIDKDTLNSIDDETDRTYMIKLIQCFKVIATEYNISVEDAIKAEIFKTIDSISSIKKSIKIQYFTVGIVVLNILLFGLETGLSNFLNICTLLIVAFGHFHNQKNLDFKKKKFFALNEVLIKLPQLYK